LRVTIGVYIDGFNFYYCVYRNRSKRTLPPQSHKWLNLVALTYFTAPLTTRFHTIDTGQAARQRRYVRALSTLDRLTIVNGKFQWVSHQGWTTEDASGDKQRFWHFEEKRSDVNLAGHLVRDVCQRRFDEYALITNDSDLIGVVDLVVNDLGATVHHVSPHFTQNGGLRDTASTSRTIDIAILADCCFPATVIDSKGREIHRPSEWTD
jgi:hypothetical protein